MNQARWTAPLLVLGAIALLLADWLALVMLLMRSCVPLYEGGNITECAGGLSEEQALAASAPAALVLLAVQLWLITLVRRRR